ncbi:MAG: hypothetical protein AAGB06_02400 [Verrucomicrobiota bacterium]
MAIPSHRVSTSANSALRYLKLAFILALLPSVFTLSGQTEDSESKPVLSEQIIVEIPSAEPGQIPESLQDDSSLEENTQSALPENQAEGENLPPAVSDPIAVRIVDNYINALGGEEALSRTQNMVIRAKEVSGQEDFETLIFREADGRARVERIGLYNGRPSEFHWITDSEQFWSVNLYRDKELVQWFTVAEMNAFLFEQSLYPPLYKHAERGVKLQYLGKETQNRIEYFLVRAYLPGGFRIEYLFDTERFLPYQYRFKIKYNGDTGFRIITPTRYKRIQGALWEMDYTIHFGELPLGSLTVDRAEGNQSIPEELFFAPERKILQGALPDSR